MFAGMKRSTTNYNNVDFQMIVGQVNGLLEEGWKVENVRRAVFLVDEFLYLFSHPLCSSAGQRENI